MRPGLLPVSRPTPCSVPNVEVEPLVVELFAQDAVYKTDFGLGIAIEDTPKPRRAQIPIRTASIGA